MTHSEYTAASTLPFDWSLDAIPEAVDERSRRALTERMSVLAIGRGTYEVENEDGETYLVDLPAGRCTCPDHHFRGVRCKHIRRVALEITAGAVPAPDQIAVECERCGETTFLDEDTSRPYLCEDHELSVGDTVYDRNSGDPLLVVGLTDRRADEVSIPRKRRTVADHYSNREYDADAPVVAVVYPQSLSLTEDGPAPGALTVYSFPRPRLSPTPVDENGSAT